MVFRFLTSACLAAAPALGMALLTAAAAGAQEGGVYQTASGPLEIRETDDFTVEVHVGETVFSYDPGMYGHVLEQHGDAFLIFLATGGNACPGYFAWINTGAGALAATEPFGTCSEGYEVRADQGRLALAVDGFVPGEGKHLYLWDGAGPVSEEILPLPQSDAPPGSDPGYWLGKHPAELLDTADWEELLLTQLTPEQLDALRHAMKLSSGFEMQDGWVAAYGFDNLSDATGAIALHPAGELLVAFGVPQQPGLLWGETDRPHPEAIRSVMDNSLPSQGVPG